MKDPRRGMFWTGATSPSWPDPVLDSRTTDRSVKKVKAGLGIGRTSAQVQVQAQSQVQGDDTGGSAR